MKAEVEFWRSVQEHKEAEHELKTTESLCNNRRRHGHKCKVCWNTLTRKKAGFYHLDEIFVDGELHDQGADVEWPLMDVCYDYLAKPDATKPVLFSENLQFGERSVWIDADESESVKQADLYVKSSTSTLLCVQDEQSKKFRPYMLIPAGVQRTDLPHDGVYFQGGPLVHDVLSCNSNETSGVQYQVSNNTVVPIVVYSKDDQQRAEVIRSMMTDE